MVDQQQKHTDVENFYKLSSCKLSAKIQQMPKYSILVGEIADFRSSRNRAASQLSDQHQ